ncbi:MAG: hypothetical protein OXU61_03375 [Gammaproteobacteria bacterium]|nr:hypothetical protein [Gammaproteobacteria bacterium]
MTDTVSGCTNVPSETGDSRVHYRADRRAFPLAADRTARCY